MTIDRLVLDSNVLISAVLVPSGNIGRLYSVIREHRSTLLFSDATYQELSNRLMRDKFDRYVSRSRRQAFLAQVLAVSEHVSILGQVYGCRDRDDDRVIETAVLGHAGCLITGDKDLLDLEVPIPIPILSPRLVLDRLEAGVS